MRTGRCCPQIRTDPIQVVHDLSILDGQLADQLLFSIQPPVHHIRKAKIPWLYAEHRNVRDRTLGQIAKLFVLDLMRRVRGHLGHHLLQRNPDRQDLIGDIEFILHSAVHAGNVQIGRNGVGDETRLDHRHRERPFKAAPALAHVEENTPLAALDKRLTGPQSNRVLLVTKTRVHVRIDVAGPQLLRQQIVERPLRMIDSKIHHHRNVSLGSGNDGLLHRLPFRAREVSSLDADNGVGILERHGRRLFPIHVIHVLLVVAAAHARADNIEHGKYARLRAIDNAILEVLKVAPSRATCIHHRRDPNPESETIRRHTQIASIGVALARARVNMNVDVDQPGSHIQTLRIDCLERRRGWNMCRHLGNLAILDRHVHHAVNMVFVVQYVSAAQQQVIRRLGLLGESIRARGQRECDHRL